MNQIPNEVMAVLVAEALAVLWLVVRIDKKLAVLQTKLRYIEKRLGLGNSESADL